MCAVAACQASGAGEDLGEIRLAVAATPMDAACLRVTVTGPSGNPVVRTLALTPGSATNATLSGLPVGSSTVKAEAFSTACSLLTASSVANWQSDPVSVVLTAGTPVRVQLVMRQVGQIQISVDWDTGGTGGMSGAGGATGVADVLNGQMLLAPCRADTQAAVCSTVAGACPPTNTMDRALSGVHLTDRTVTLGGNPGQSYSITLHIQGEVESKQYVMGAMDQDQMALSPAADGFATGGVPTSADAYGVYLLRVANPGSPTPTDYFLNSLQPPGVSNHTTYGVDYTATVSAQGGAAIRLLAADANCAQIKNCGPVANDGSTCANPIIQTNVEPLAQMLNPTFNFNAAYNGQWLVMTVTGVTSP